MARIVRGRHFTRLPESTSILACIHATVMRMALVIMSQVLNALFMFADSVCYVAMRAKWLSLQGARFLYASLLVNVGHRIPSWDPYKPRLSRRDLYLASRFKNRLVLYPNPIPINPRPKNPQLEALPIGPIVVPFWDYFIGFYI